MLLSLLSREPWCYWAQGSLTFTSPPVPTMPSLGLNKCLKSRWVGAVHLTSPSKGPSGEWPSQMRFLGKHL